MAGGAAAALVLGVVVAASAWSGGSGQRAGGPTRAPTAVAPTTAGPAFPVVAHRQGRVTVNVPAEWDRTGGTSIYVDYSDPTLSGRKVRILIENSTATPVRFMQTAERTLMKPTVCPAPYTRIDLREATLLDRPAAELEYTCGEGPDRRHGIWRAIVVDGKAYSFFLTAPHSRFEESRIYFEEMLRSYQLRT